MAATDVEVINTVANVATHVRGSRLHGAGARRAPSLFGDERLPRATIMKILLAVDGSPHSQDAVDEVARRPWPSNSTIRVLSVIQPYTAQATEFALAAATLEDMGRQQASEAKHLTVRAAEALKAGSVSTETAVREGDPRAAIVDEADEWGADLIVVGSHGRTGVRRWLLGSVAGAIVSHAPCSVEVVRKRTIR